MTPSPYNFGSTRNTKQTCSFDGISAAILGVLYSAVDDSSIITTIASTRLEGTSTAEQKVRNLKLDREQTYQTYLG
jgi:hypothetical protein